MHCVINLLVNLVILVKSADEEEPVAVLLAGRYQFYDAFGDETSVIYTGGSFEVVCIVLDAKRCGELPIDLWGPDQKPVKSAPCIHEEKNIYLAVFRIEINESPKFGTYECHHDGARSSTERFPFYVPYRLCSIHDDKCAAERGCEKSGEFCVVTPEETKACSKIPTDKLCKFHTEARLSCDCRMCPVDQVRYCNAFAHDNTRTFARMRTPCPDEANLPRFFYAGKPTLFNDIILLEEGKNEFIVKYSNNPALDNTICYCKVKTQTGQVVRELITRITNEKNVDVQPIFKLNSQLFKVNCSLYSDDRSTRHYLSRDDAALAVFAVLIRGDAKIAKESDGKRLTCDIVPTPSADFKISYAWKKKDSGKILHAEKTYTITETGEYQCQAKIVFKSCAPHRMYQKEFVSGFIKKVPPTTTSTKTTPTTTAEAEIPSETMPTNEATTIDTAESAPHTGAPISKTSIPITTTGSTKTTPNSITPKSNALRIDMVAEIYVVWMKCILISKFCGG